VVQRKSYPHPAFADAARFRALWSFPWPLLTVTTAGFPPRDVGPLFIQPLLLATAFGQVATKRVTPMHYYRIPIIATDPVAQWVAEGAEIVPSDPVLQELLITPSKVAGLTIVSSEMANDSDPAVAALIGEGLARGLASRVDQAAFSGLASPAAPGLTTLSGVQTYVAAGAFANLEFRQVFWPRCGREFWPRVMGQLVGVRRLDVLLVRSR